jgi:hypothetical protein
MSYLIKDTTSIVRVIREQVDFFERTDIFSKEKLIPKGIPGLPKVDSCAWRGGRESL